MVAHSKVVDSDSKPAPRRSVISRGIKRTLQTAQFESLVIEIGFEEEIEWNDLKERQKKIDNWNTVLLHEFKQSSERILKELGLTHKKAWFKDPSPETIEKYKHIKESQESMDLDDLDTLNGDK